MAVGHLTAGNFAIILGPKMPPIWCRVNAVILDARTFVLYTDHQARCILLALSLYLEVLPKMEPDDPLRRLWTGQCLQTGASRTTSRAEGSSRPGNQLACCPPSYFSAPSPNRSQPAACGACIRFYSIRETNTRAHAPGHAARTALPRRLPHPVRHASSLLPGTLGVLPWRFRLNSSARFLSLRLITELRP